MTGLPTIAIVAHDVGGRGGMERHLEELVLRLKHEAKVVIVASTLQMNDSTGVRFVRIPVIPRPIPLKMVMFAIFASLRLLTLRYDILHTTGAIVWNKADVSTVHFCHAGYLAETAGSRAQRSLPMVHRLNHALATRIALWMERLLYRPNRTHRLVAVSQRVKRELLQFFPYADEDVQVIANGVDVRRFHPFAASEKLRMRRAKGFQDAATILLFMGGDWSRKGLDHALQAFTEVADENDQLHFVVVGKGDVLAYQVRVSEPLRARVHFVGVQDDTEVWFGLSDLFILPSSYETFSLVVHEAAAAGLVVLCTQVGGVEELIEDGVSGFFIPQSPQRIASILRPIAREIAAYRSVARRATSAVQPLTWAHTYKKLAALYRTILCSQVKWRHTVEERSHEYLGL